MSRQLQHIPILGVDLTTPDYLAARRPGTMREVHNLYPVDVIEGRPVWRPFRNAGGAVTLTGLESGEKIRRAWVYRTPYRSLFDDQIPPQERIVAITTRRVLLLEDVAGNGTLGSTTLYRYPDQDADGQAAVVGGRVVLSLRLPANDEWHTFQIVGKRLFELPIPIPEGIKITAYDTDGQLPGGVYSVRVSCRLWDGTPGPWSRPFPVIVPSTTTGRIEIDATGVVFPSSWDGAISAVRVGIALIEPDAQAITDEIRHKLFRVDHRQLTEISLSDNRIFTWSSAEDLDVLPVIDIGAITAHRVAARTVYALNGRLWLGNVRIYFADVPLGLAEVTAEGGSTTVIVKPDPPLAGGVEQPSYLYGVGMLLWWYPSKTSDVTYNVYRAQIDSFGASSRIASNFTRPGVYTIEYLDQSLLYKGITYHYWVTAVHTPTGGESDPTYLGFKKFG